MSASTRPANPNALGTLEEAIDKIKAMPAKPAFMIHTGDITHLSKAEEFDDADQHHLAGQARRALRAGRARRHRRGASRPISSATAAARRAPAGTRSMPAACTSSASSTSSTSRPAASAISATSSSNGSRTISGPLDIDADRACSRISRCGRVYPQWGWGTEDGARALGLRQTLRLGHRAQRPHPPGDAEGRGQRHLPHRALDRLPAARAGHGALAGPDEGRGRRSCAACSALPASTSSGASRALRSSIRRCKAEEDNANEFD